MLLQSSDTFAVIMSKHKTLRRPRMKNGVCGKFTRPGDAPRPGAPILGPARRLHINNVPGRMNTKKTLANYR